MCSRVPDSKPEHSLEFFFRLPLMQASVFWMNLSESSFQLEWMSLSRIPHSKGKHAKQQRLYIHFPNCVEYPPHENKNLFKQCEVALFMIWGPSLNEQTCSARGPEFFFLAVAVFFLVSALRMKHMPINWYNPYFFLIMQIKFYTFWLENLVC